MIKIFTNMNGKNKKTVTLCDIFDNLIVDNIRVSAGAVTAASLYGSSYTKMMRLLAAPALQHCKDDYLKIHQYLF
jgi:hypothetical protein